MGLTAAIRTLRNYILYLLPFFWLMRIASFEFLSGDFGVSGVISRLLVLCIVYMKDCPTSPGPWTGLCQWVGWLPSCCDPKVFETIYTTGTLRQAVNGLSAAFASYWTVG